MRKLKRSATTGGVVAIFAAALAASALTAASTDAFAYSGRVRDACADDYFRFCPHYPEGSPKLRGCMRAHGKSLSKGCVRALVDAGLVPKKDLRR